MKVVAWDVKRFDSHGFYLGRFVSGDEPKGLGPHETVNQLVTLAEAESAVKQARIDALEEAQKVADELSGLLIGHCDHRGAEIALSVRDSIRSLKETP